MKNVRILAKLLFFGTRAVGILYWAVATYLLIVLLLSDVISSEAVPVRFNGEGFTIFFPFTRKPFLLGDNNPYYITTTLLTITLYGVFLWLLSNVFQAFKKDRLFTQVNVTRLTQFYVFNLIVPVLCVLVLIILNQELYNVIIIAMLHILAGVFAFFMAVIFKQGLHLQEEQDLTL